VNTREPKQQVFEKRYIRVPLKRGLVLNRRKPDSVLVGFLSASLNKRRARYLNVSPIKPKVVRQHALDHVRSLIPQKRDWHDRRGAGGEGLEGKKFLLGRKRGGKK